MRGVLALPAACAAAAFVAACGGAEPAAPPAPALPRALASHLAAVSDSVARRLDAGEPCAAKATARSLARQAGAAIDAGRVPAAARAELRRAVSALASEIRCVRSPPATTTASPSSSSQEPEEAEAPPGQDGKPGKGQAKHPGHEQGHGNGHDSQGKGQHGHGKKPR